MGDLLFDAIGWCGYCGRELVWLEAEGRGECSHCAPLLAEVADEEDFRRFCRMVVRVDG